MSEKRPHVLVVGSSNTDMVVRVPRLPRPGETISGGAFAMVAGGKGANQAVAAARLGAQVTFVARLGSDVFGHQALDGFQREGIDTQFVQIDSDTPTGVALIGVDAVRGENVIMLAPGANAQLSVADVARSADAIRDADVLICQLESPLETVQAALQIAQDAGVRTILNPAPACALPKDLLALVTLLTPNETEAVLLAGDPNLNPLEAARKLREQGVSQIVLTLGAKGAQILSDAGESLISGRRVENVVDTTAAGDCFTGALAVALAEGQTLAEAAQFANAAAALSVTVAGAQPSLPRRADVEKFRTGLEEVSL